MYVLVRDGVEFWSTPLLETGMPSLTEGECAPYEDGELWRIADDEFVSACNLGFAETKSETFTLSNWERVKEGKMKEIRVGLIRGRHEMPVDEYIFDGPIENVHDYVAIRKHVYDFIFNRVGIEYKYGVGLDQHSYDEVPLYRGKANLVVYVTGLTPVTVELVSECLRNGVSLTLMNYDTSTGTYRAQRM